MDYVVFEVGDWVDWAYEPNDPNGPYGDLFGENRLKGAVDGKTLNGDAINDRLIRYRKPPYRVVQVFEPKDIPDDLTNLNSLAFKRYPTFASSAGHPQIVRVVMFQKPTQGGPKTKIRGFSGALFKKVPNPRSKKK